MAPDRIDLLSNGSATGSDMAVAAPGQYGFLVEGANYGTVKLQLKTIQGTYVDITSGSLTANGMAVVQLPSGIYRANVNSATGVYACLVPIPTMNNR